MSSAEEKPVPQQKSGEKDAKNNKEVNYEKHEDLGGSTVNFGG